LRARFRSRSSFWCRVGGALLALVNVRYGEPPARLTRTTHACDARMRAMYDATVLVGGVRRTSTD